MQQGYLQTIPGLAEAVATAKPHDKHTALLAAVRRVPGLENASLAASGDEGRLQRRKVLDASGKLLHEDHEAWLKDEAERSGIATAWSYLKKQNYWLSECAVETTYITVHRGGAREDNFLQLEIDLEDERMDRRLFDSDRGWDIPRDIGDLVRLAEDGPRLPDDQSTQLREPAYRLSRAVDVAIFASEAEQVYNDANARDGARRIEVTSDNGEKKIGTVAELFPESKPGRWNGRRLFEDWAFSSAGRSGARLCEHWALRLADWTDPRTQERDMSLIPIWGFAGKLAEVKSKGGSDYALYSKLEAMDARLKVPFGWYFYMLHGNRVRDGAGERVIHAAEAGLVVLPEQDYKVLKAWQSRPYGF